MTAVHASIANRLVSAAAREARKLRKLLSAGIVSQPDAGPALVERLEDRRLMSVTATATGTGEVNEADEYWLHLSASSDGSVIDWTIDWGDGSPLESVGGPGGGYEQMSLTHVYLDGADNFTITAVATDVVEHYDAEENPYYVYSTDTVTTTVEVDNVEPTFLLEGDTEVLDLGTYYLSVSEYTDPGQDTVSSWLVAWGDGTTTSYGGNVTSFDHNYLQGGSYNVTVTATDEDGSYSVGTSVLLASEIKSMSAKNATNGNVADIVNGETVIMITGRNDNDAAIPMTEVKLVSVVPAGGGAAITGPSISSQDLLGGSPGKQKVTLGGLAGLTPGDYTVTFSLKADPTVTCTMTIRKD